MLILSAHAGEVPLFGLAGGNGGEYSVRVRSLKEAKFRSTVRQQYDFSCGSAALATAMILATFAGSKASGRHMSVTIENPTTRIPQWTATITSGTVDMPTTSAPITRRKRYSARVSKFGPGTATNTP